MSNTQPKESKAMASVHLRDDDWSNMLQKVASHQDEKSFAALFAHFAPLVKGFCQQNTAFLTNDAAEELAQEVMFKVWQKAPKFDAAKASASTWIFTITRNTKIDYLRKHGKHQYQPLETEDIWDESQDNQPFVYLQQARSKTSISAQLGELPKEQKKCLEKVYMEDKSHMEISKELGLPLGTVKSRVRLGLKRLQANLGMREE